MSERETIPHRVSGPPIKALRVVVKSGPDSGVFKTVEDRGSLTIGTAPGNDLILTDETVSRYHLELTRRPDGIFVEDHGSMNGTRIGSVTLGQAIVVPGAAIEIGKTVLEVGDGRDVNVSLFDGDALFGLRGRSPSMRQLMARTERAARTDVSILLLGETGTGKEVIANAVHQASPRAEGPFETVDCGSLLPTLIASELFGHEKGAFTGADRQHIGAFERADGGTLFLDEIGELPANLQSALLGALERRRFRRVGGSSEIAVDVRVVAATHRDLRGEVNTGKFRQDLYYRLAVLLMRVPPLRERTEDIPTLVDHFLREMGHTGPIHQIIPRSAMLGLEQHHWPGNVRELRNVVEASMAMGEPPRLDEGLEAPAEAEATSPSQFPTNIYDLSYKDARAEVLRDFEASYVRTHLDRADGNAAEAARQARMDRSYLFQLIRRHGLK